MATLKYGQITLGLAGLLATEKYHKEPWIEGATYCGTKYTITVRGYYNPNSVSATGNTNSDPTTPTVGAGNRPPITEAALRFMLEQPRQELTYTSGNTVVLQSPFPGMTMDARNGPFCKVIQAFPEYGESKTWIVDATFTVFTNDCPGPGDGLHTRGQWAAAIITANVWVVTQTTNVDGLTIREIEGKTTLRTDLLTKLGFNADDMRPFMFPPPFPNSRREVGMFRQNETQDQAQWRIRDVELMNNVVAAGVTRVSLKHRARITTRDRTQVAWELGERIMERIGRHIVEDAHLFAAAGAGNAVGIGAAAAALAFPGQMMLDLVEVSRFARSTIPTVAISVTVAVWGRRDCSTKTLERFALDLANARLSFSLSFGARLLAGQEIDITEDCSEERCVVLHATMNSSISGFLFLLAGLNGGFADIGSFFPAADGTPTANGNGIFANTLPGLGFVNDNQTRGSYTGEAVPAPYGTPCGGTPIPGQPPNATFTPATGPNPSSGAP